METTSIRNLLDRYGTGIKVSSVDNRWKPFKIVEDKGKWCTVEYEDGDTGEVKTYVPSCNDYLILNSVETT